MARSWSAGEYLYLDIIRIARHQLIRPRHICKKPCHRPGECSGANSASKTCGQVCAKPKSLCEHPCQSYCHGKARKSFTRNCYAVQVRLLTPEEIACSESSACQAKVTMTCPCGQRKKEVKCQTSEENPSPSHARLECDDECLRLERNRRLAEALKIDPASELTDHIPYSETTLKLFRELSSWAEDKEREFRVFAQTNTEVRMRFAPMPPTKRQFLHVLAEDFRLESHSEDWEAHRHVVISKTPGVFPNVAPSKTLGQCIRIRDRQAAAAAAEKQQKQKDEPVVADADAPAYNALLLTSPAFGITIPDMHAALDPVFASHSLTLQSVAFLPTEEVLLRPVAAYSAASGFDATLTALRTQVAEAARTGKLVASSGSTVVLVTANQDDDIVRRERLVGTRPDPAGWNAVAGRATAAWGARKDGGASGAGSEDDSSTSGLAKPSGRKMLGLRKKTPAAKSSDKPWRVLDGDVEC